MKKLLSVLLAAVLLLGLTACAPFGAPESSAPVPQADLAEPQLIAAVKTNLGVPDAAGITYTVSEKYYWDAAGRYYVDVDFYEYGSQVAGAFVDPTSGELLRNIRNYTAPESTPARDAFIQVLNSQRTFVVKTWTEGKVEQRKLKQFSYATDAAAQKVFVPAQYAFVDMDGDSAYELVVLDRTMDFFLVLRYSGGSVLGYLVPYRALMKLRKDGRFMGSGGAAVSTISRMTFDGTEYVMTELAYRDQQEGVYRLDGAAADKATVEAYYTAWEQVDRVTWTEYDF